MSNVLSVQRVAVEPGDLVIVKVAGAGTAERAQIAIDIKKSLPEGARVWVTSADVREVVTVGHGDGYRGADRREGAQAIVPLERGLRLGGMTADQARLYAERATGGSVQHLNPYAVSAASVRASEATMGVSPTTTCISPTTTCISPTTTSSAGTHAFRVEGLSGLGQNFVFTEESIRSGAGGGSYGSGEIDAQTGKRVA